jgi:hypothetical protein
MNPKNQKKFSGILSLNKCTEELHKFPFLHYIYGKSNFKIIYAIDFS